jgi:hypothetical protein
MRNTTGLQDDPAVEMPPRLALIERRRVVLAEAAWTAAGRALVPGFDNDNLVVSDPGGAARLVRVGLSVSKNIGLVTESFLASTDPFATELCALCDLVAIDPIAVHFEASLATANAACVLVRGVALPLAAVDTVQIVLSWREVLNRTEIAPLERDFVSALRQNRSISRLFDPFLDEFAKSVLLDVDGSLPRTESRTHKRSA